MLIHVVAPGEYLGQIAGYYHVSVAKIINANHLPNPNRLVVGESILIPTEDVFHTVSIGETLWGIARTYRTTVQAITSVNRITNLDYIYPGLKLYIKAPIYRIKPGDTLQRIAQNYEVTLQNLLRANDITNPANVSPDTAIVIPIKQRPVIYVNAYIYQLKELAASIVREDGEHLTYLSPFAYRIKENGSLEQIDDTAAINTALAEKAVPMMAITNFTSTELGNNLAHIILASNKIQETLLTNIIKTMEVKGYKGVNIDFENVLPADRKLYNQFLKLAVDRLHPRGFFVSSALAPKTNAAQVGNLYEAHDYEAHGRIADFVVLMTYEWGYRMGPPQAISPINEIKRVLDYAVSVIPREKIYFGFQIYARDWVIPHVQGEEAETFSNQEAIQRAVNNNAVIMYDIKAQSPFYRYVDKRGIMHEVWFEDARSTQAKFDMVKNYKLKGISYWALGYPFPQNWALLEDNFTIKKLI